MAASNWITEFGKVALGIILLSNIMLFSWLVVSRWFKKVRIHRIKKGLINFLGLAEWHASLSPKEQALFKKYYNNVSKVPSTVDRLTEADIYSASETPAQLLVMVSASSMMHGDYTFAEKLLTRANSCARSPWEKQQVLLAFSYLFFKQRDQLSGAIENCIEYSEKAIKNIERFGISDDLPPTLPFDQLIAISEESEDYRKAAELAGKAAKLLGVRHKELSMRYAEKMRVLGKKVHEW